MPSPRVLRYANRIVLRRFVPQHPRPSIFAQFGLRSPRQVVDDVSHMLFRMGGDRPPIGVSTLGFFRPDLSLPAYAGFVPTDGLSPIYNFFDRHGGGRGFASIATRTTCRDWRGGRLTYDEHDGTDFVCPVGTPLVAPAPGVLVAARDSFLRGGLTACVDHGAGVVTQVTHLARLVAEIGQPLRRGDVIGLSGSAGLDMLSGFPWVAPHVHFMVWVHGRPVDPYLARGEGERPGTWFFKNEPRPSGPLTSDPPPPELRDLEVNAEAIETIVSLCHAPKIRAMIEAAPTDAARIALLEDSLHHDRSAWPPGIDPSELRPAADASRVHLSLPLPRDLYKGARAVDAPWTRPPVGW